MQDTWVRRVFSRRAAVPAVWLPLALRALSCPPTDKICCPIAHEAKGHLRYDRGPAWTDWHRPLAPLAASLIILLLWRKTCWKCLMDNNLQGGYSLPPHHHFFSPFSHHRLSCFVLTSRRLRVGGAETVLGQPVVSRVYGSVVITVPQLCLGNEQLGVVFGASRSKEQLN